MLKLKYKLARHYAPALPCIYDDSALRLHYLYQKKHSTKSDI